MPWSYRIKYTQDFPCEKRLNQRDGLACLVFNVAMEKAIREYRNPKSRHDFVILARSATALEEGMVYLNRETSEKGL